MAGEVRYTTTSDGIRIGYAIEGEGPPLVVVPATWMSFALLHELSAYEAFLRRVARGRTLIRVDVRGTGVSQREVSGFRYEVLTEDVWAVVDAIGAGRVSIITAGPAGPLGLQFAIEHPELLAALVLVGTRPRTNERARSALTGMAAMARGNWQMAARTIAGWNLRRPAEEATRLVSIYARSIAGENVADAIEQNLNFDLTAGLPKITARTLVIHSEGDTFYPFDDAQLMASVIPGARLLPLEGNVTLTSPGDSVEMLADAINAFLDEDAETRRVENDATASSATASGLRTVLFTDLVGHTEMMQRLGDEKGRDVLREHERITREVLKQHGGTEVKTMGDGFMASFGSVTKAVECAVALQKAFDERNRGVGASRPVSRDDVADGIDHAESESGSTKADDSPLQTPVEPLSVRVGLNAGEPIEEDGDLFGATVILAARIAAKAEGGEILVADTVRGLCSGKGFLFADRGEFVAKCIEEPVRISEVNWRE